MSNLPPSESDPWSAQPTGDDSPYGYPGMQSRPLSQPPGYPPSYGSVPSVPLQQGYPSTGGFGSMPYGTTAPGYGAAYPGAPVPPSMPMGYTPVMAYAPVVPVTPSDPGRGLAITGMVLGIISLFFFWAPACIVGWPLAILGVIFSGIGMRSKTARGMAIAGLVCSILTFALWIGAYIVLAVIGAAASSGA